MLTVDSIYKESVLPLSVSDRLRLAEMILKNTNEADRQAKKRSVLELLDRIKPAKKSRTADEIDEYLRTERDSWDN
jgi:hypothetical protein